MARPRQRTIQKQAFQATVVLNVVTKGMLGMDRKSLKRTNRQEAIPVVPTHQKFLLRPREWNASRSRLTSRKQTGACLPIIHWPHTIQACSNQAHTSTHYIIATYIRRTSTYPYEIECTLMFRLAFSRSRSFSSFQLPKRCSTRPMRTTMGPDGDCQSRPRSGHDECWHHRAQNHHSQRTACLHWARIGSRSTLVAALDSALAIDYSGRLCSHSRWELVVLDLAGTFVVAAKELAVGK